MDSVRQLLTIKADSSGFRRSPTATPTHRSLFVAIDCLLARHPQRPS
ncbi:MAG: hypothetical protein AB1679_26100 [Actinomycetota bacterium]